MTKESLAKVHADMVYNLTLQKTNFSHVTQHYENLIPFLQNNNIDPYVYFGVLLIDALEVRVKYDLNFELGAVTYITSNSAMEKFMRMFADKSKHSDIKGYVISHYIGFQKEAVIEAYELGESVLKQIQDNRGFNRQQALIFCTDFDLIPDLYILVCKEFYGSMRYTFFDLRPRLENFLNRFDKHAVKLKKTIESVRFELFPELLKDAPTPLKKQKKPRDSGITRLRNAWREW